MQNTTTIETVELELSFDELFQIFGHDLVSDSTLNVQKYDLQIQTDLGFKKINALYSTPEYEVYRLTAQNSVGDNFVLDCADKHLLAKSNKEWDFVTNLKTNDEIIHENGILKVKSLKLLSSKPEVMCDVEVRDIHRFYANGFLSHNTHTLIHFGAQALLKGKNVFHYSFELNERVTGIRYDSHLTQIASTDCLDHKAEIKSFFEANPNLGRLIIKYLPGRSSTVNTLRSHIDKMKTKGCSPDLLIVDYAGIMRSTNKFDLLRMELKEVIQELRDLAEELDIPCWTALQSNKEGSKSDIVDLDNMAESYAQAAIADVVFGLGRKSEEKSTGLGSLFIAKNRAGMDGIKYKVMVDTARSTISILTKEDADALSSQVEEKIKETEQHNNNLAAKNARKLIKTNFFKPVK
jgi:hypothetical protein